MAPNTREIVKNGLLSPRNRIQILAVPFVFLAWVLYDIVYFSLFENHSEIFLTNDPVLAGLTAPVVVIGLIMSTTALFRNSSGGFPRNIYLPEGSRDLLAALAYFVMAAAGYGLTFSSIGMLAAVGFLSLGVYRVNRYRNIKQNEVRESVSLLKEHSDYVKPVFLRLALLSVLLMVIITAIGMFIPDLATRIVVENALFTFIYVVGLAAVLELRYQVNEKQ